MNDTVELLQACHRGTITAINSLEQVMDHVQGEGLQRDLQGTLHRHKELAKKIDSRLADHRVEGEEPNAMARMGVWMTTEMRMMGDAENRDHQIAKLVINGCNTGIQMLSKDINRLHNADGEAEDFATELVTEEQRLMDTLRLYL